MSCVDATEDEDERLLRDVEHLAEAIDRTTATHRAHLEHRLRKLDELIPRLKKALLHLDRVESQLVSLKAAPNEGGDT